MAGVSSNVLSKGGIFWGCTAWTWAVSKQGDHDFRVVMRWPANNRNSTAVTAVGHNLFKSTPAEFRNLQLGSELFVVNLKT